MPLRTTASGINTQSGNVTQIIIAEQANYADEAQDDARTPRVVSSTGRLTGGDFYKYQPRINSADIAREGTTIESAFFDGSAAQSKDAAGPIDISGGMSIAMSGNGTALPLRMLTQDKNPSWNIYGGTGQAIPAAVTLVASAPLSDGGSNAVIAENLSSTTNPVQLIITPSNTASIVAGGRGTITIKGTDNWDTAIEETIQYSSATAKNAATSRLWYKTVTEIASQGWDEASGRTYAVTARDSSAAVTFTPQDDDLVAFWTAEVAKGVVPNRYYGLCMQSATISITREELVAFDCTFLGRRGYLYSNLAGDTGPTARRTDAAGLDSASPDVFAGWQGKLTAENDLTISLSELTLTINQELAYTNALGSQFQLAPPGRGAKRLVQFEVTAHYSPQNDFSTYFESNQVIPNVKLSFDQVGYGAYPYNLTLEAEEMQFTADPDPAVDDAGIITQTLIMKAVRPRAGSEYRFTTRYSDYDRVRIYS